MQKKERMNFVRYKRGVKYS